MCLKIKKKKKYFQCYSIERKNKLSTYLLHLFLQQINTKPSEITFVLLLLLTTNRIIWKWNQQKWLPNFAR